jgi:hypothetical protein
MKGTEEPSAKALEQWLKNCGLGVSWEPVADDPPDFVFTVGNERWAVEATELHQYLDKEGSEISRPGVEKPLERMCKNIKAKAQVGVNRKYFISTAGPLMTVPLAEIERRAIEYIASGETRRQALDLEPVIETDPEIAALKKRVAEEGAQVFIRAITTPVEIAYMTGLGGTTMGADQEHLAADVEHTLRYSLDRMLADKLPKLAKLTDYDRRILLVWRGYFFAEPSTLKRLLAERKLSKADLDSILLVTPNGEISWVADPGELF